MILKDKRTNKPRGFGFITYNDISCVTKVMLMRDKHYIQGKWVDCKSAIPINEMRELQDIQNKNEQKVYNENKITELKYLSNKFK